MRNVTDEHRTKLLKWKAERKKKKAQESRKKPPFIVGIVRHHFYSPVSTSNISDTRTKQKKTVEQAQKNSDTKKISKATEKRLLAKVANVEIKAKTLTPLVEKKSTEISSNEVESNINRRESFAPPNHKFNPPAGLPEICREDASLNKNNISANDKLSAAHKPCRNSSESIETVTLDVSSTQQHYTVEYFEHLFNKEKNRLQKLCEEWMEIQLRSDISEDIRCQINQEVGQTTILITKKFKKFHDLMLHCQKNKDNMVTCTDLHGFWDMMDIEIKDCDSRFAKLEKLRARCWQEDHQSSVAISTRKKIVTPARKSSLRMSAILSGRKKKMAEIQGSEKNSQTIMNVNNESTTTPYAINGRAVSVSRRDSVSQDKRFLETSKSNYMYTSTPFPVNVTPNIANQLSTPLIAMKVSQLYDKSIMQLSNTMVEITPERTPRLNLMEKLDRSKSENLRMKLACKTELNHLTMSESSELHIDWNSGTSSKKINKSNDSNECTYVEGKSNSGTNSGSAQTVIEKTINDKNSTSAPSIDSVKTLAEDKRSVKEASSSKSSKTKSFGRSIKNSINKTVKSPFGVPVIVNISPISRNVSTSIHDRNTSSKMTPSSDRVSKKRDSSIKKSCNKIMIFDGTPQVSRKTEMVRFNDIFI